MYHTEFGICTRRIFSAMAQLQTKQAVAAGGALTKVP